MKNKRAKFQKQVNNQNKKPWKAEQSDQIKAYKQANTIEKN